MKIISRICDISIRTLLLFCALYSFIMLAVALVGQYYFELHPCNLCIYQRIPYAVIITIGILGAFLIKSQRLQYIIALFCALLFLLDASIAGYHTGVELEIFKGPTACSSDSKIGQTLEEMRAAIMNAPLVTCAQAMVYVLGLSMAAWNMIAAILGFLATSFILLKNHNNRRKL